MKNTSQLIQEAVARRETRIEELEQRLGYVEDELSRLLKVEDQFNEATKKIHELEEDVSLLQAAERELRDRMETYRQHIPSTILVGLDKDYS